MDPLIRLKAGWISNSDGEASDSLHPNVNFHVIDRDPLPGFRSVAHNRHSAAGNRLFT